MMTAASTVRALIAGTRSSELARIQTEEVLGLLRRARPDVQIAVQTLRTGGDRDRRSPLSLIGGKGVFVKELEIALRERRIDLAVHSLKDLPPVLEPGLTLAAISARADPRDALVSREGLSLASLPAGARVGTSSVRRKVAVLRLRPDLAVVEVRGNVDTRIRKAMNGEMDAVVLAAAGLERLGRISEAAEIFAPDLVVPSPGQGALAIEVREDDALAIEVVQAIDDPVSHCCAAAERAFLACLGAGCTLPAGAYAAIDGSTMRLWGMLAGEDGSRYRQTLVTGPAKDAELLGQRLADALLAG